MSLLNHEVARKAGLWDKKVVDLDKETLKLVKWWRLNLMDLFLGGLDIRDPFPVGAVEIFPDAAGVCKTSCTFNGLGAVELDSEKWLMWQWPTGVVEVSLL